MSRRKITDWPIERVALRALEAPPTDVRAYSKNAQPGVAARWGFDVFVYLVKWHESGTLTYRTVVDREIVDRRETVPRSWQAALVKAKKIAGMLRDPVACMGLAAGVTP